MKLIASIFLFLTIPLSNSVIDMHEYYVGVTNIEYIEEQESLQIISQIFIDDFETLLKTRYDETITLAPDSNAERINTYMSRYLSDKLKIEVNGSPVSFKYLGKEYKHDITYCYLEIEGVTNLNSVSVTNQILFDVFPEQQNIVRLKGKGKNRSFLLLPDNDNCMLNFN